jgi:spore germination cell wall hydrolase CwlJ-like protein
MAEVGLRDVVGDPLALNPRAMAADRSLQTAMVRNPGQTGGKLDNSIADAIGNLGNAVSSVLEGKQDEYISEGKLKFMQGATEQEIASTGNKWTMQGWQALSAADKANRWYADEMNALSNGGQKLSPEEYNKSMMSRRAQHLADLPDDPAIRKLYISAFDDLGPRLSSAQMIANNKWNQEQTTQAFNGLLESGSYTNSDAPGISGNTPLALSPGKVRPTVDGYGDDDIDLMTRAVLGEAAGEGVTGQAAVAHNILNRVIDGGFGGRSIKGVVLKKGQYSAFNKETGYIGGKGSNDLINMDPNSAAYQNARQTVMHVLSGHNVDPTNGSTHYVTAGLKPDWRTSVEMQSNGAVRIGNHEFMGKARNLGTEASGTSGILKFVHKDQTDLDVGFASALTNTGLALGRDLTIQSGHRDATHPVEAAKSKPGMHSTGKAADIDMTGMSDEERKNLVLTLRQNGVVRFSTYDKHPNMLHTDMSTAQGSSWFMHNKSNKNLASAPKWFQEAASAPIDAGGVQVNTEQGASPQDVQNATRIPNASTVSIAQTQMQDTIRGYNMPKDKKATAVAQQMLTQLSSGSSALWDNVGGVGFLQELGATPSEIRQVQNAHAAYEKQQANKFDMDRAKWESSIPQRILTGEITEEDAQKEIQSRYDAGKLTDQDAYSMVSKVAQAAVNEGRAPNMDPSLQRALATTYASIRKDPNTFTAEWAQGRVKALADQYGMPPSQLQQRLAEVWQTEETTKQSLLTGAAQAAKEAKKRDEDISEARAVIAAGKGMDNLTGSIDGIPKKQWAVRERNRQLQTQAKEAITGYMADGMSQADAIRKAAAVAEKTGWSEYLSQGGVVDEDLAGSVTAGASGIVVEAGGKVNADAKEALDTWMRLKEVDPTGAYASKYTQTEQSRNLLMAAEKFYTGGYDLDSALRKASEFVASGLADPPDITKTTDFSRKLNKQVTDNFDALMGAQGWFESSKVRMGDKVYALNTDGSTNQLKAAITAKAWAYYAAEPQNDTDIIMKKAAQDVIKDSVIIGGNVLTPRAAGGTPILDQMGLRWKDADGKSQAYPADAPSAAVDMWVKKYAEDQIAAHKEDGTDPTGWARAYAERATKPSNIFRTPMGAIGSGASRESGVPPYYASWDQDSGTLVIQLWDTPDRKTTVPYEKAKPLSVSLADVGEYYRSQVEASGPNILQQAWAGIWGTAHTIEANRKARQAGADMGALGAQLNE